MAKVLFVATSPKTRGGISAVIHHYQSNALWNDYHCIWIGNHIDRGAAWKIYYFLKGLARYIYYLPGADIVHFHFSNPIRELFFLFPAKLLNKKIISHFHANSVEETLDSRKKRLYQYFFRKSNCIIVLSEYWEKQVRKLVNDSKRVEILYNPCSKVSSSSVTRKEKTVLFAGTLIHRKGYETLIRAFAKAHPDCPDWNLELAGNGEIEKARSISEELGIASHVIFLGWISGNKKHDTFDKASVFCLPSYAEGFPMAVLDAFSYGLPVITTPVGGIPDVAEDGENMLLFQPGDIDQLSALIIRITSDEALRDRLSKASLRLAEEVFSVDTVCKKLRAIYDSLLA